MSWSQIETILWGSYSQQEKRDKDKLCQDPEINPGEADIVSLNVIESPWCLVRGGRWSTDLLTFKSTGNGLGAGEGMGGGHCSWLSQFPEYFFPPVDPASFSVVFRMAATYLSLWVFLAPETDS